MRNVEGVGVGEVQLEVQGTSSTSLLSACLFDLKTIRCTFLTLFAMLLLSLGRSCNPVRLLGASRYLVPLRVGNCRGCCHGCRLVSSVLMARAPLVQKSPSLLLPACIFLRRPSPAPAATRMHRPVSAPAPAPKRARFPSTRRIANSRVSLVATNARHSAVCLRARNAIIVPNFPV